MPVVDLALSRLHKLLGGRIPKKAILETLPFLGLDIESESGDDVRVEYSPNRPDYSTDYGIALGLEGLLGIKKGGAGLRIRKAGYRIRADPSVSKTRSFVTGICALGGTVDGNMIRQMMAMQEDLHSGMGRRRKKSSIGIHDLDAISFPILYTTAGRSHEFVPLNETKPMTVEKILSETETGKDYGHLLGDSRSVPVIVDSQGRTVSLPPVINAAMTAVTAKTTNLFVEVTGLGRDDVEDALSVVATVLQRAGFRLHQVRVSGSGNSTPAFAERQILLDPNLANETLGLQLTPRDIVSCLKKSRISASQKGKKIRCIIPRYRFDIFGPMDIVEEAALGYGIDKLEPKLSPSRTVGGTSNAVKSLRTVDDMMIGLGYTEALNSSLTSARILYESANRKPESIMSVLDSKSREHTILRDSILPGLVDVLSRNVHQAYPQRLYETGIIFVRGNPIGEQANLAAVSAHADSNFSELKSVLQSALQIGFGLKVRTKTSGHPVFARGRSSDIVIGGKKAGMIGEIGPETLEHFRIRVPVTGFEIKLTGLIFD